MHFLHVGNTNLENYRTMPLGVAFCYPCTALVLEILAGAPDSCKLWHPGGCKIASLFKVLLVHMLARDSLGALGAGLYGLSAESGRPHASLRLEYA